MKETCTVDYIDHVGVVVRDIDEAFSFFKEVFGIQPAEVSELADFGIKAVLLTLGQTRLEVIQPLRRETTVGRFLENRGEGLHHLAFNLRNVDKGLKSVKAMGLEVVDETSRKGLSGLVGFIHPKSVHGVLTELVQTV